MNEADELRNLLQRYARAADQRDIDALAELFHPDAAISGARGEQTLDAWLDTMRGPRTFPTSMHVLGDPLIELDEGGEQATLDTYAVVYQLGDRDAGHARPHARHPVRRRCRPLRRRLGDPAAARRDALDALIRFRRRGCARARRASRRCARRRGS